MIAAHAYWYNAQPRIVVTREDIAERIAEVMGWAVVQRHDDPAVRYRAVVRRLRGTVNVTSERIGNT